MTRNENMNDFTASLLVESHNNSARLNQRGQHSIDTLCTDQAQATFLEKAGYSVGGKCLRRAFETSSGIRIVSFARKLTRADT